MSESDAGLGTPFNVIGAFLPEHDSTGTVDVLVAEGVPRSAVTVHRPGDGPTREQVAELEAEMQDEIVGSWGNLSGAQAKGAVGGVLILGVAGIVLGLVAGFAWAYLLTSSLSRLGRIVIAASVTGLAGNGAFCNRNGRCPGSITSPSAITAACTTALRSSRTLPGQW